MGSNQPNPYSMTQDDIRAGDVLLVRGTSEKWSAGHLIRQEIAARTKSPYTHAAIALNNQEIVDARPWHGVKIRPFSELLAKAECVAVLRHPDVWDDNRALDLQEYAAALQSLGTKYNYHDLMRFEANKSVHQDSVMQALNSYFENAQPAAPTDYGPFFCSELVVACLVRVGYISQSAAIVFAPSVHSPGDLAREPTFGYLVGVLSSLPGYQLRVEDPLNTVAKYQDIIGLRSVRRAAP